MTEHTPGPRNGDATIVISLDAKRDGVVNFTPGPWVMRRVEFTTCDKFVVLMGEAKRGYPGFYNKAQVVEFEVYEDPTEAEANATLIAAAPDLLDALNLLEHAASLAGIPDEVERRRVGMVLEVARAAIAKAEGVRP